MDERSQQLLKTLVESYVREGTPVGSRSLAKESGLELSSATIRNIMSELEDMGMLQSPHTSAGRVPTVKGYRLFVDSLLQVKTLDKQEVSRLIEHIDADNSVEKLVESTSALLSNITQMAGLVTLPRQEASTTLRHIEFLPLSGNQVLAILVLNEKEVKNHIIRTSKKFTQTELQQVANYINQHCAGESLPAVRQALLEEMKNDRINMNHMMQVAIDMADEVIGHQSAHDDYVMAGQTNLMNIDDMSNMGRLRSLFDAFSNKSDILNLLDQCIDLPGIQIFIGEESGYNVLDDCSVITSNYAVEGQAVGVLGVIGPTRMAYDRVIPIVDMTSKLLSTALNQRATE